MAARVWVRGIAGTIPTVTDVHGRIVPTRSNFDAVVGDAG
jgi:hypothetical protein